MGAMIKTTYTPIIKKVVAIYAMTQIYKHIDPKKNELMQMQQIQNDSIKRCKIAEEFKEKSATHTQSMIEQILFEYNLKLDDKELLFYHKTMGKMIVDETFRAANLIGRGYFSSLKMRTH
jgi:hypothetical protein